MPDQRLPAPDAIRAILMRRIAERLGAPSACPTRACRRRRACAGEGRIEAGLPCQRAARAEDRARFDALLATVEAIRDRSLWPEPSCSAELRAVEAVAIDILRTALPLMPNFGPLFEDWLSRYQDPPIRPGGTRAWLRYARAELARTIGPGETVGRRDGRSHKPRTA
jgi:hypothetical protein